MSFRRLFTICTYEIYHLGGMKLRSLTPPVLVSPVPLVTFLVTFMVGNMLVFLKYIPKHWRNCSSSWNLLLCTSGGLRNWKAAKTADQKEQVLSTDAVPIFLFLFRMVSMVGLTLSRPLIKKNARISKGWFWKTPILIFVNFFQWWTDVPRLHSRHGILLRMTDGRSTHLVAHDLCHNEESVAYEHVSCLCTSFSVFLPWLRQRQGPSFNYPCKWRCENTAGMMCFVYVIQLPRYSQIPRCTDGPAN